MRPLCSVGLWFWLAAANLFAAEQLAPPPARYFNDYARVVPLQVAENLNRRLEDFEKASSSQILVVVYPALPSDSALEDLTVRTAQSWRAGQKSKDNGAVLFVFIQDRKMRIEVGYGLEGKLPDSICKRIIDEQIAPGFRRGDYAAGLTAGVNSLIQAASGEYRGTGRTVNSQRRRVWGGLPVLVFVGIVLLSIFGRRRRGWVYNRRGSSSWGGWFIGGGGWGGGGGGGFSSGGFSGGGGSFGGGGASGSW